MKAESQAEGAGLLDGLRYFEVEIDGVSYWLTEHGLADLPKG